MSLTMRIHPSNPQHDELIEELRKFDSGGYGERYVRKVLEEEFGDSLLHISNVWLDGNEIDLISVTDRAVFLFEIKNIRGHVEIRNVPPQLVRTTEEGRIDIFKSPLSQLEMNELKLKRFLNANLIELPVYAAVVFAFHNANIIAPSTKYPILIGNDVCRFVWNMHPPQIPAFRPLVELLNQQKLQYRYVPKLSKYNLQIQHLRTGVICPKCDYLPMQRQEFRWFCPKCHTTDRFAHLDALRDYYELISNKITNKECRQFLHLRNRHETKRILQSVSATSSGNTRGKIYTLQF